MSHCPRVVALTQQDLRRVSLVRSGPSPPPPHIGLKRLKHEPLMADTHRAALITQSLSKDDRGKTEPHAGGEPFAMVNGKPEGHRRDRVIGTYLDGALEYPDVLRSLLAQVAERRSKEIPAISSRISKDEHYDRLADWFEQHADRELFEKLYLA